MIWFDDDCERRRLIYIDETFINALSSVKQSSVGCTEIYKSHFLDNERS